MAFLAISGIIDFFDPAVWLWGAVLIMFITFVLIFFNIIRGKKEPF